MNNIWKRSLSFAMALVMVFSLLPVNVLAEELNGTETPTDVPVDVPATEATDHTHGYESAVTTAATCTEDGVMTYTCSCGESYTESISAAGHAYDNGVCTCGAVEPTEAPKVEDQPEETTEETKEPEHTHAYESEVTEEATCTEDGVRTYTCSCEDTYTEVIAATGHAYENGVCACGETEPTEEPKAELSGETRRVYFQNVENWEKVYAAWSFDDEDFEDEAFPGAEMNGNTELENVWYVNVPVEADGVVFNDGVEVTEALLEQERLAGVTVTHEIEVRLSDLLKYNLYTGEAWLSYADEVAAKKAAAEKAAAEKAAAEKAAVAEVQALIDSLPATVNSQTEYDAVYDIVAEIENNGYDLTGEQMNTVFAAMNAADEWYSGLEAGTYDSTPLDALEGKVMESALGVTENGGSLYYNINGGEWTEIKWQTNGFLGIGNSANDELTFANGDTVTVATRSGYGTSSRPFVYTTVNTYIIRVYHNIAVSITGNDAGYVSYNNATYKNGDTIKLYAGGEITVGTVDGYRYETTGSLKPTVSGSLTVNYISEDAANRNVTLKVVGDEYAKVAPSLSHSGEVVEGTVVTIYNTEALDNTANVKYTVNVAASGVTLKDNSFVVGEEDVTVTVTFTKYELTGADSASIKFDSAKSAANQLNTLKQQIFTNLGVSYFPDGVTYDQIKYEYKYWYTYSISGNQIGDTTQSNNYAEIGTDPADKDETIGYTTNHPFGYTGLGTVEHVKLSYDGVSIEADITLTWDFTITWDVNGTKSTETYAYGETPSFKGSTDKAADAQYTYTFSGWNPAIKEATGNQTYTAQYTETVNQYTITFVDENGTTLYSADFEYGSVPVYGGEEPSKENANFKGWTPAIAAVTGVATYTAEYTSNDIWKVQFVDGESLLKEFRVNATLEETLTVSEDGKTITHNKADGTTDSYTLTDAADNNKLFTSWDKAVAETYTADTTYTAQWVADTNNNDVADSAETITVNFSNATVKVGNATVTSGVATLYDSTKGTVTIVATPDKGYYIEATANEGATLAHSWKNTWQSGIINAEYRNVYTGTLTVESGKSYVVDVTSTKYEWNLPKTEASIHTNGYLFSFANLNLTADMVLDAIYEGYESEKPEGEYSGSLPIDLSSLGVKLDEPFDYKITKKATDKYPEVTHTVQVTVSDNRTNAKITSTYKNGSDYNTEAEFKAAFAESVKFNDTVADFEGLTSLGKNGEISWTPNEDGTYTATVKANNAQDWLETTETFAGLTWTVSRYTVKFVDKDGNQLSEKKYDYNTAATDVAKPEAPAVEGHTFAGWDPAVVAVTEDKTYTATYTINQYTYTVKTYEMDVNGVYQEKSSETMDAVNFGTEVSTTPVIADGFALNTEKSNLSGTIPANDNLVLNVYIDRNQYDVIWVWQNAEGEQTKTDKLRFGSEIVAHVVDRYYEVEEEGTTVRYYFQQWGDLSDGATVPVDGITYTAVYNKTVVYEVKFDTNDGTSVNAQYIEDGKVATEPTTTREGYRFDGWYLNDEEYDFATPVTEDIELIAQWVQQVTVTFEGAEIEPQTFDINGTATEPEAPTKEKAIFGGWYLDDAEYDFDTPVTENITLTANWIADLNENKVPDENEIITIVVNKANDADAVKVDGAILNDDGAYIFDSTNPTVTITATPVVADGVSTTYVASINDAELTYNEQFVATAGITVDNGATITVDFAEAKFDLKEDAQMRFYVGMELPDKETLYNSVVENPTYGENVKSVEYLARPADTYPITIPVLLEFTVPLINYPIKIGGTSYDVDLPEAWLDVGEEFKTLTTDELQNQFNGEIQKIRDKIAEIDLSDISSLSDAWDKVQQFLAIGEEVTNLVTTITNEAQYLGYHQFGAGADPETSATEILKIVYENDAMHIENDEIVVTLEDDRAAAYIKGGDLTFKYNLYTDDDIMNAIYLTDAAGNVIEGTAYKVAVLAGKNVGEYTYNVYFDGNYNYKPATPTEFTLTVEKAPVSIDFDSQTVVYGNPYDFTLVKNPAGVNTIDFMVGLDLAEGVAPYVQIKIPPIDLFGIEIDIPSGEYSLSSFIEMMNTILGGIDGIGGIIDILTEVQNTIGLSDMIVKVNGEMHPEDIGLYLAGAVTVDQNYETAYTVDYLMVVPNAIKADLEWVHNDSNGVFTPELLQHGIMGAKAMVNGVEDANATDDIQYLFLSLTTDAQGEMVFDLIQADANTVNTVAANGAYTQMAYILEWGNSLYYAVPIVRAFAIMPNTIKVEIVDNEGTDFVRTFDNAEQAVDVELIYNGTAITPDNENLTVTYTGIQSNTETWNSETAPTHAGVYLVTATYVQTDESGEVIAVGMDVQTLTILPAETSTAVNDMIVQVGSGVELEELIGVETNSGVSMPDMTVITAQIASDGTFSENGWSAIKGNMNVDFPDWVDGVLAQYAPSLLDGMTVAEFSAKVDGKLDELATKLNELGLSVELTNALTQAISEVTAVLDEVPENVTLTFNNIGDLSSANVGAYLVAAIVTDSDHYPSADYGILVVTPVVTPMELKWNYEDEDNIWTRELLKFVDLNAKAFNHNSGAYDEAATEKITYQFIGIDKNGELIVSNTKDSDKLPNGAYIELAYINLKADGVMTVSNLIARQLLIVPGTVEVTFKDVDEHNARYVTFDNEPEVMEVEITNNGQVVKPEEGELTVTYIGVQTNGKTYNSTTAPVHAGVYTVVADYREYTSEGSLANIGAAVGLITIAPAESTIDVVDSLVVTHKPGVVYDLEETMVTVGSTVPGLKPDTIIVSAQINTDGDFSENGWSAVGGNVNIDFPRWVDELLAEHVPGVKDGMTAAELKAKLTAKLPGIIAKLEELGATNEIVNSLSNLIGNINTLLAEIPDNMTMTFEDDVTAKSVGAYVVAGIVADSDHIPAADAGVLVIVPDVEVVELKWNHEDENNIWTRELLTQKDLWAKAFDKETGKLNEGATATIHYQFIGVDKTGSLIVKNTNNADELPNGVYTQLAYIELEADGHMYISDLIARNIAIVSGPAEVNFVDVNGNVNPAQIRTFNNKNQVMNVRVTINGRVITPAEGTLTVTYIGAQTNTKTYNSTTAPTHAGVYTVIADYRDYTSEGSLAHIGAAIGIMAVEPAQSTMNVTGGNVVYDGEGHTASVVATGSGVTEPDYTLISGGAHVSGDADEVGVDAFHGNVNIDFPAWMDKVLAETEFATEGVDTAYLIDFIDSYRDDVLALIPVEELAELGVSADRINAIIEKLNAYIDELLAVLDKLPKDVALTFNDDVTYTEPGYYFYYGIVTDSDHYPSSDTGLLVIEKKEMTFDLLDTTVEWTGEGQMVDLNNPENADFTTVVIDRENNTINIILDEDAQYVLNAVAKILGVEFDGDVQMSTIIEKYSGKELAAAIVGLIGELEKLELPAEIQKALAAVKNELETLPENGTITVNGTLPSEIGTYEVYAISYSQYFKTTASEAVLEITRKTLIADNVELDGELTYNGAEQTQEIIIQVGDKTLVEGTDYIVKDNTATDAGEYILTIEGIGNYTGTFEVEWSIEEAAPEITTAPEAVEDLTYNGGNQALVTAGTATGGDLVYSLSQNGPFTAEIPVGKDAGTYTVYYKVVGDENYADSEVECVEVTIAKAESKVTTAPEAVEDLTYNGGNQALVIAGTATGGDLVYSLTEDGEYSDNIPTGLNAGTYTVYYKVVGDENYADSEVESITVTIAKATPVYTAPTGLTAVEGQTLADVELPEGFTWEAAPGTSVGNAGSNTFYVIFTPADTDNYETVRIPVTVEVAKNNAGLYPIPFDPENDTTGTIVPGGTVEIDGVPYVLDEDCIAWVEQTTAKIVTTYKYHEGNTVNETYPTNMYVWYLTTVDKDGDEEVDEYNAERIPELDNFFEYNGTSIRVGSAKNGIRFFTSIESGARTKLENGTLINDGVLKGAKMVRAGTVFKKNPTVKVTLENGVSSDVYGGKAGNDFRVFGTYGGRNWFTGMLVGLETDAETITAGIAARPYAELVIGDETVVVYGGQIERSIYYVACQNQNTFEAGSSYDNFVEGLIEKGNSVRGEK